MTFRQTTNTYIALLPSAMYSSQNMYACVVTVTTPRTHRGFASHNHQETMKLGTAECIVHADLQQHANKHWQLERATDTVPGPLQRVPWCTLDDTRHLHVLPISHLKTPSRLNVLRN